MRVPVPALAALLLSPALAAPGCAGPPVQLEADGPVFHANGIRHWKDGGVRRARLVDRVELQGVPARGWVGFHRDGGLKDAELSRDHELSGHLLPEGTRVFLDEDGVLESAYLSHDMVIDGIPVNGGWGKIATSFHPNGRLKHVFLSEDAVIQGVPCEASLSRYVVFDADGKLIDPSRG